MKILGIDPGTGRLGWAIIEVTSKKLKVKGGGQKRNNPELVMCGLIETPARTKLIDRLELIFDKLSEVIEMHTPQEMAVEELFFVKNVKTGISVAHARGVVMLCAIRGGLEVFEYKPNEIKLGICGYGHASKAQMGKMLKYHLPKSNIDQDDVADAVAVALYHIQMRRGLKNKL